MNDEPMIKFPAFDVIGADPAGRDLSISHAAFCRCSCKEAWLIELPKGYAHTMVYWCQAQEILLLVWSTDVTKKRKNGAAHGE